MNLPSGAVTAIRTVRQNADRAKALRKATTGLESHFVKQLLGALRRTTAIAGGTESHETQTYREMMDDALAGKIAETGRFGIGEVVYKNMIDAYLRSEGTKP